MKPALRESHEESERLRAEVETHVAEEDDILFPRALGASM